MSPRYWIIVASRDHVQRGLAGGFTQANHGKAAPLRRMHQGDWIVYYSPKKIFGKAEPCQQFTAIGQLKDERIYQQDMGNDFVPYRRDVEFKDCNEIPIRPLIAELTFIKDKQHWGAPFRFGVLEIPAQDFQRIAAQMLPGSIPR
ncbi:MAG: EVE domain-containing protein [Anaerolineales bacterium]|nr:EVE domain-containing protein [Anaerolineales bacterium]